MRLAIVLLALAGAASGQTVVLAEKASCPNDFVALAEVAELRGADARLAAKFGEIYLGAVPGVYDRDVVRARMARYGFDGAAIRFEGAGTVRVEKGTAPRVAAIPASTAGGPAPARSPRASEADRLVLRAVDDHVRRWVGERVDDATFELDSIDWPDGAPEATNLESAWVEREEPGNPTTRLTVQVKAARGAVSVAIVRARVRYFTQQIVARTDLPSGRILGATDFSTRIAAVVDPANQTPLAKEALLGRRLVRALREGEPIGLGHVETVPIVERGKLVRILYRGEGFSIEATGKAEGDAGIGEWVMVRNVKSDSRKQPIRARAIGPGTVEVTPQDSGR